MKFEKVLESEVGNTRELLGLTEISILSSITAMARDGASLDIIELVNQKVAGISATIWSMFPIANEVGSGDKKARETLQFLENQLKNEVMNLISICKELADGKYSRSKDGKH